MTYKCALDRFLMSLPLNPVDFRLCPALPMPCAIFAASEFMLLASRWHLKWNEINFRCFWLTQIPMFGWINENKLRATTIIINLSNSQIWFTAHYLLLNYSTTSRHAWVMWGWHKCSLFHIELAAHFSTIYEFGTGEHVTISWATLNYKCYLSIECRLYDKRVTLLLRYAMPETTLLPIRQIALNATISNYLLIQCSAMWNIVVFKAQIGA